MIFLYFSCINVIANTTAMTSYGKVKYLGLLIVLVLSCGPERDQPPAQTNAWAMQGFIKVDSINPILSPRHNLVFDCPVSKTEVRWEERNVLNPTAIVKDNKVHLIYRAQDHAMTSRLGLAISEDGLHFEKQSAPIFYPAQDSLQPYEWPGGVEDPRIVESEDGRYVLTYTAYDGKTARLFIATSTDLRTWVKHGPVLAGDKYLNTWSKSGAIVSRLAGDKIVATKINGKYWMYFGDTSIFVATSDDLIHWQAGENQENQNLMPVLNPRPGYFDSRLVEPGPYALLKEEGILLIYNASNAANFNEPNLPKFTYAAGQALFDKNNPFKLIDRTDDHFIYPEKDYEKLGEVNDVCFVEGLVYFKNRWFLYYGTADSKIAVAVL